MGYEYDVFFSYKRDRQSDEWHYMVKDKLEFWLKQELNQPAVRIFFDREEIHTGERWRARIVQALLTSKCIVCVWSPLYFRSTVCMSEWRSFTARETAFNRDLVLPARYHDGTFFPQDARDKQMADFRDYTSIMPKFWETPRAVDFVDILLKRFAQNLADLIQHAPPFDPAFPVIEVTSDDVTAEPPIGRPGHHG